MSPTSDGGYAGPVTGRSSMRITSSAGFGEMESTVCRAAGSRKPVVAGCSAMCCCATARPSHPIRCVRSTVTTRYGGPDLAAYGVHGLVLGFNDRDGPISYDVASPDGPPDVIRLDDGIDEDAEEHPHVSRPER